MRTRNLILAAISLLLISGASIAQDNGELNTTVEMIPCPTGVISGFNEVEGETVECGAITVPVNYDAPDGATIDLVYARLFSRSLAPAADPVIYLHGGPGSAELGTLTQGVAERFETLRQRRDVIIFDQRGAGYSFGEVDCKAIYDEQFESAFEEAQAALGPDAPLFAPGMVAAHQVYGDCADALTADGVDLSQYNTVNNARDVASLAGALGHDNYNLYGLSYGTRLGLELLRQNPPGLRSVILDSVMPTDIPFNDRLPETNDESFQNIVAMCQSDEACAAAYPDLTGSLNSLFAQLDEAPIELDAGFPLTSDLLASFISNNANSADAAWRVAYMPRVIVELEQGITETWEALNFSDALVPQERSERFRAPDGDVPFSARTLLNSANDVARQAAELDDSATTIAEQALELIDESDGTSGDRFLAAVKERWEAPFSAVQAQDFRADLLALPAQEAVAATLEGFVNSHFSGADADILLGIVAEMKDEDIAALFENARFDNRFHDLSNGISHYLYFCNEGIPFNSVEGPQATQANVLVPGLTRLEAEKQTLFLEGCERLPTGTLPESFHDPVTGDGNIPVMVFGGTNDTQTATSWTRAAAANLVGAQYVEFPNAGHGVINFSQCAKHIAAAFVDNPEAEIESGCTADLMPRFVLPDEPLAR